MIFRCSDSFRSYFPLVSIDVNAEIAVDVDGDIMFFVNAETAGNDCNIFFFQLFLLLLFRCLLNL